MSVKHKLFGFIFNKFSSSEIKNNQVTFIVDGNNSFISNYKYIKEEFEKRGNFEFFFFNKNKLSVKDLKRLSKSKYVFLNDNYLAMAYMNFNPQTVITQLWHAPGAFKKFGASTSKNPSEIELLRKANEKVTYLITTSKNISNFYAEAFQIDKSKIKPLGISRMDYYFKNHDLKKLRKSFDLEYGGAKGKKIALYAPTFRDSSEYNHFLNFLDIEEFNEYLGDEYILAIRLHPKVSLDFNNYDEGNFIDVSEYENEQELFLMVDLLISDYSSVVVEFAALNKPVVLFTYDYDYYLGNDRGFYMDYDKTVPGRIAKNTSELIDVVKDVDNFDDNSEFLEAQFDELDGQASKRIVDLVLK